MYQIKKQMVQVFVWIILENIIVSLKDL